MTTILGIVGSIVAPMRASSRLVQGGRGGRLIGAVVGAIIVLVIYGSLLESSERF